MNNKREQLPFKQCSLFLCFKAMSTAYFERLDFAKILYKMISKWENNQGK